MAIWLLGPDPNGQCCGCETRATPCDNCTSCTLVAPNAFIDGDIGPAYPDLAWATDRMDNYFKPSAPDCKTMLASYDLSDPLPSTELTLNTETNRVQTATTKYNQGSVFQVTPIFKFSLPNIVAGEIITLNPLQLVLDYSAGNPTASLQVSYNIYLLASDGSPLDIVAGGYLDGATGETFVSYTTPTNFSLTQANLDAWDGYFYFLWACVTTGGNVDPFGTVGLNLDVTIQSASGARVTVCPIAAAYYDGATIKYLECTPSSLP